jgi:hypothetical protein
MMMMMTMMMMMMWMMMMMNSVQTHQNKLLKGDRDGKELRLCGSDIRFGFLEFKGSGSECDANSEVWVLKGVCSDSVAVFRTVKF